MPHRMRFIALLVCFTTMAVHAQQADGPPIALSDAVGKTGAMKFTLTERSPLSTAKEIARRLRLKPNEVTVDYDLSKQVFELYVPTAPGEDGKYGLLIGGVFINAHGFAPAPWRPVLERHHLIWIGPDEGGDDHPDLERIGQSLDATENARKSWPIDENRVYLSMNTWHRPFTGLALYFPDVFSGQVASLQLSWFEKLTDSKRRIWNTDNLARPLDQYWSMAKSRSRIFFVSRIEDGQTENEYDALVFSRGYEKAGFKYLKRINVPHADMGIWSDYSGGWLDQGIEFLDAPLAEIRAAPKAATMPIADATPTTAPAPPASSPRPATKPAAPAEDPNLKAAAALSLAKNYVTAQKYALARPKLQKIVDTWPATPAAKEAKKILDEIKGK